MPNIKIKGLDKKYHTYHNVSTLRVKNADTEGQYVEYTYKNGTINVDHIGEADVNEFAKVNVTVEEYTNELKTEMNDRLDMIGTLVDTIITTDLEALNESNIEETDSESEI